MALFGISDLHLSLGCDKPMDVFPGCPLWIAGEGWDGPVYLQTPEGTYLECIKG